jgi:hypothetical protein
MALGFARTLTEMGTRHIPRSKTRLARETDILTAFCECRECGILDISKPYRLHGLSQGYIYFFLLLFGNVMESGSPCSLLKGNRHFGRKCRLVTCSRETMIDFKQA